MTRKDYEAIALTLRCSYANDPGATIEYFEALCNRFAFNLQQDNPRFDRARFLAACGV
jgi:hypothetical protein